MPEMLYHVPVEGGLLTVRHWVSFERHMVALEDYYFHEQLENVNPETLDDYVRRNLKRFAIQKNREDQLPAFINAGPFEDKGNACGYRILWGDNPDQMPQWGKSRKTRHLACIRAVAIDGRYSVPADESWLKADLPDEWRDRCIAINDLCRRLQKDWSTPLLCDLSVIDFGIYKDALWRKVYPHEET